MSSSKAPTYPWEFRARFRARAFGWKGSKLAAERLKQAISEIKAVARHSPVVAAEGAVLLLERISPAFEQIDSSSGAIGTAVYHAIEALVPVIGDADAPDALRERWLTRLFAALQDDQIPYIEHLGDRWGEVCRTPALASAWADELVPTMLHAWQEPGAYFPGTMAALSAMLHAGRNEELLDLTRRYRNDWWSVREYGVKALAGMGRVDEAIALAEQPDAFNDQPVHRTRTIEALLLAAGRREEAYDLALVANASTSRLTTYRNIHKKYPEYQPAFLLKDLIRRTPGEEGKWFATAKSLKLYELALQLASASPVDHHTLMRAVDDFKRPRPDFALGCALAAAWWMAAGYGYELTRTDLLQAVREALELAEQLGEHERVTARLQAAASFGTEAGGWLVGMVGTVRP